MNRKKNNKRWSAPQRTIRLLMSLTLLIYPFWHSVAIPESAAARTRQTSNRRVNAITKPAGQNAYLEPGGIKVLAEGFHSKIDKPFAAVLRDEDAYAALTKLDDSLPKLDADFFKDNAVLAAYLGARPTGGYSVEIAPSPVDINVLEKKPAKGMMQPQVITSPFKVVALNGVGNDAVRLNPDEAWRQHLQSYRVTAGTFRMTGGFAGRSEEFGLQGVVLVMRYENLVSFIVRVISFGTKRRLLMESSTGVTDGENKIQIKRMSDDSFVDPPSSGLSAAGAFSAECKKLTLNLLSRPSQIADGYSGNGTIEAELVSSEKP